MPRFSSPSSFTWLAAGLFGLAVALPLYLNQPAEAGAYSLEIRMLSARGGFAQVYYDTGKGFNEDESVKATLKANEEILYQFALPAADYRAFRFDPTDREGVFTISAARLVDRSGKLVQEVEPDKFQPAQQVEPGENVGGGRRFRTTPGATDPITLINGLGPISLRPTLSEHLFSVALWSIGGVLLILLAGTARHTPQWGRLVSWAQFNPRRAILLAAALGVAWQMHPVIFAGRSLVSPDDGPVLLLYENYPTLPSYQHPEPDDAHGSDVGALMWQQVPYSVVQHEAVFRDHTLPLWDRYELGGIPLLGQGQTMFADPLHWLPIVANGAAWAWDMKFVIARWLFACGLGLAAWQLGSGLAGAVVAALSSAFIGFFAFRYNHPAVFSVCYSPWILVAWSGISLAGPRRQLGVWLGVLLLATWMMMNSGTMKEAYMLILGLHFAGVLVLLLSEQPWSVRCRKLIIAAGAGVIFLLLSAPLWISFLAALGHSYTIYDVPAVSQLPPSLLIGFFDDLFYRQLHPGEIHWEPSSNFLILLGLGWSLAQLKVMWQYRAWRALALSALVPLALVFGVVPAGWILKVPFLANVVHVENTFGCVLIVHAIVLAAFGWGQLLQDLGRPGWHRPLGRFVAALVVLLALYFGSMQGTTKSVFFIGYIPGLILALTLFPWLAGRARIAGQSGAAAFVALGVLTLWRHGEYLHIPFDNYVVNPGQRVELHPSSPALARVRDSTVEPARALGLGQNFFPGYGQTTGIESIYGVDALRSRPYYQLAQAFGLERVWRWEFPDEFAGDSDIARGRDLLNVRYFLATSHGASPPADVFKSLGEFDLDVYERPSAWPRAFFTDGILAYDSAPDFAALVHAGDGQPVAAVLGSDVAKVGAVRQLASAAAPRRVKPAYDYALRSDRTDFTVEANGPGVVVLTETYYKNDFEASVDGRRVPYFRVNHAFKGIYLESAGVHRVSFRYWPEYFTLALWLAAGGLLLLVLAVGYILSGEKTSSSVA
jgi:hypothetical protein